MIRTHIGRQMRHGMGLYPHNPNGSTGPGNSPDIIKTVFKGNINQPLIVPTAKPGGHASQPKKMAAALRGK